jgi:hypothetical protein
MVVTRSANAAIQAVSFAERTTAIPCRRGRLAKGERQLLLACAKRLELGAVLRRLRAFA